MKEILKKKKIFLKIKNTCKSKCLKCYFLKRNDNIPSLKDTSSKNSLEGPKKPGIGSAVGDIAYKKASGFIKIIINVPIGIIGLSKCQA